MSRAPRLAVQRELVPLLELDSCARVVSSLLCGLQLREVLARYVHHDTSLHLHRPGILFDYLDRESGLRRSHGRHCRREHRFYPQCSVFQMAAGASYSVGLVGLLKVTA